MLIYNVTTKVTNNIANDWLQWQQQEHIPQVIGTGCFTHAKILRLLEVDDAEGPTYAVQFFSETRDNYDRYLNEFAPQMRNKSFQKWGNQFISFRSLMHIVQ